MITEFKVIVVIVAVSACSLPVQPVGIPTLFWLLPWCHRCLISSSWTNVEHSSRLLEMTVGARFPSSLSPPFPVAPPSSPSCTPFSYPSLPCPPSVLSVPFSFPLYPLNQSRAPGSAVSSPSRSGRSPVAKRFWCIFKLKSAHFCHLHNETFIIFTVHFDCVQRR